MTTYEKSVSQPIFSRTGTERAYLRRGGPIGEESDSKAGTETEGGGKEDADEDEEDREAQDRGAGSSYADEEAEAGAEKALNRVQARDLGARRGRGGRGEGLEG